jgi:hypothetical protein
MSYGSIYIPVEFTPLAAAFQFAAFARVRPACGCLRGVGGSKSLNRLMYSTVRLIIFLRTTIENWRPYGK